MNSFSCNRNNEKKCNVIKNKILPAETSMVNFSMLQELFGKMILNIISN